MIRSSPTGFSWSGQPTACWPNFHCFENKKVGLHCAMNTKRVNIHCGTLGWMTTERRGLDRIVWSVRLSWNRAQTRCGGGQLLRGLTKDNSHKEVCHYEHDVLCFSVSHVTRPFQADAGPDTRRKIGRQDCERMVAYNYSSLTHQKLSICRYGHAQHMSSVTLVLVFRSFSTSVNGVDFLPSA